MAAARAICRGGGAPRPRGHQALYALPTARTLERAKSAQLRCAIEIQCRGPRAVGRHRIEHGYGAAVVVGARTRHELALAMPSHDSRSVRLQKIALAAAGTRPTRPRPAGVDHCKAAERAPVRRRPPRRDVDVGARRVYRRGADGHEAGAADALRVPNALCEFDWSDLYARRWCMRQTGSKTALPLLQVLMRCTNPGARGWDTLLETAVADSTAVRAVLATAMIVSLTGMHPHVHPALRAPWWVRHRLRRVAQKFLGGGGGGSRGLVAVPCATKRAVRACSRRRSPRAPPCTPRSPSSAIRQGADAANPAVRARVGGGNGGLPRCGRRAAVVPGPRRQAGVAETGSPPGRRVGTRAPYAFDERAAESRSLVPASVAPRGSAAGPL